MTIPGSPLVRAEAKPKNNRRDKSTSGKTTLLAVPEMKPNEYFEIEIHNRTPGDRRCKYIIVLSTWTTRQTKQINNNDEYNRFGR